MIQFTFQSDASVDRVAEMLGSLSDQARPALKKALNATARDARKLLANKAQETYAIKIGGFNKNAKIQNATNGKLFATIRVSGAANELKSFKVSPASYKTGANRPDIIKGKVLQASGLKNLEKGGIKAFVVKFASGHTTVAERTGAKRLPIKVLYSPSIPSMIGSKRVYEVLRPEIGEMLQREISKQITKTLGKENAT